MQAKNHFILLTFDVEEFDTPLEYNYKIDLPEQMKIGKLGLDAITPIISTNKIASTLYTTANFADHFPNEIQALAQKHEIASHTFYHTTFEEKDLLNSKLKLEEITGKKVIGLRMPRMQKVDMNLVKEAGYLYDSSIHPTWIPGRYNNLKLPRTLYEQESVKRLPASVSTNIRLPLFWLAFKNYPYWFFKKLAIQTLKNDGYLCLYFHPWEFTNINHYNLPKYVKRYCGEALVQRLQNLITDLKPEGEFITTQDFILNKK